MPAFFQTWDSGMTMVGFFNTMVGLLVMGLVGVNPFVIVSLVNSTAAALAYGLGWVAYSTAYGTKLRLGLSIIADICWLIQEGGLSFYSFLMVRAIVRGRERVVFLIVFWFLELCICAFRLPIMVSRVIISKHGHTPELDNRINYYHLGYFVSIALCESWNGYFLLKIFFKAKTRRQSDISHSTNSGGLGRRRSVAARGRFLFKGGLYTQLFRSSELRLASLASIGIIRSITYTLGHGEDTITQFDRFIASCETMFSTVFLFDIIATKLAKLQEERRFDDRFAPSDLRTPRWSSKGSKGLDSSYIEGTTITYGHPPSGDLTLSDIKRDEEAIQTDIKPVITSPAINRSRSEFTT